jgi:tripartite-type tricarboxylate transporter receptor subunit TctC
MRARLELHQEGACAFAIDERTPDPRLELDMSLRWLATSALLLVVSCAPSLAKDWPTRPIRAIVPFTPGSATDVIPRTVFAEVQKQLGQPIIIENRVGAGGTIGIAAAAKSAPDGYTLLVASSAYTTVPATYANLSYDPVHDLQPIIPLANMANVLVVSPDKGINTLDDFVQQARARQGSMNYVTLASAARHISTPSGSGWRRSSTRSPSLIKAHRKD